MTNFFTPQCVRVRQVYGRNTIKNGEFCDLWESALKVFVGSREIAESEYIVNNTFTYKVSLLLQSEFEPPQAPIVKYEVRIRKCNGRFQMERSPCHYITDNDLALAIHRV